MRVSSLKAKGRRCSAAARQLLLDYAKELSPDDIQVTSSGVTGPDLTFSKEARYRYPLAVECKNVERLNVFEALAQAKSHQRNDDEIPTLVFTRNHEELYVAMRLQDLLELLQREKAVGMTLASSEAVMDWE